MWFQSLYTNMKTVTKSVHVKLSKVSQVSQHTHFVSGKQSDEISVQSQSNDYYLWKLFVEIINMVYQSN